MKTNILKAIINLNCVPAYELKKLYSERAGDDFNACLKFYLKDCFSGTIREKSEEKRAGRFAFDYSYEGTYPDLVIDGGDAVVISVISSKEEKLNLSESLKAKINLSLNDGINERDIIYLTAVADGEHLRAVYMVYGCDYIAYASGTNPENPRIAFKDVYSAEITGKFELMSIIPMEKYKTLHMQNRLEAETLSQCGRGLKLEEITLKTADGEKKAKLYTADRL